VGVGLAPWSAVSGSRCFRGGVALSCLDEVHIRVVARKELRVVARKVREGEGVGLARLGLAQPPPAVFGRKASPQGLECSFALKERDDAVAVPVHSVEGDFQARHEPNAVPIQRGDELIQVVGFAAATTRARAHARLKLVLPQPLHRQQELSAVERVADLQSQQQVVVFELKEHGAVDLAQPTPVRVLFARDLRQVGGVLHPRTHLSHAPRPRVCCRPQRPRRTHHVLVPHRLVVFAFDRGRARRRFKGPSVGALAVAHQSEPLPVGCALRRPQRVQRVGRGALAAQVLVHQKERVVSVLAQELAAGAVGHRKRVTVA